MIVRIAQSCLLQILARNENIEWREINGFSFQETGELFLVFQKILEIYVGTFTDIKHPNIGPDDSKEISSAQKLFFCNVITANLNLAVLTYL